MQFLIVNLHKAIADRVTEWEPRVMGYRGLRAVMRGLFLTNLGRDVTIANFYVHT